MERRWRGLSMDLSIGTFMCMYHMSCTHTYTHTYTYPATIAAPNQGPHSLFCREEEEEENLLMLVGMADEERTPLVARKRKAILCVCV